MLTRRLSGLLVMLFLIPLVVCAADAPAALKSGPEVGKDLPGPFHPYNVTGKEAGNFHCVVCTNGLDPVVLVFVRGSQFSEPLKKFLGALDEAVAKDPKARITAAAVFLFDDLKNVVADDVNRRKYAEKIEPLKSDTKQNQVVLCLDNADGPKGYNLNPEAKVTILLCSKLQVVANFAYADESKIDTNSVIAALKEKLGSGAKK